MSTWVLSRLYVQGYLNDRRMGIAVGCGVLMHFILIGSLLSVMRGIFGGGVRDSLQIVNGFIPVALGLAIRAPARDLRQR